MQNIKTKQKLIQNNKKQNRFSATAFRHWLSFSNKAESSICRSGKTLYVDDPNEKSVFSFGRFQRKTFLARLTIETVDGAAEC
jgi:hypothetical protein